MAARARAVAQQVLQRHAEDDRPVPDHFLAQIQSLIEARPHDTHFVVQADPGRGYGSARCLEDACRKKGKVHQLTEVVDDAEVSDGGRAAGVGSMYTLLWHQTQSPAHQKALKRRVQSSGPSVAGSAAPSSHSVKGEASSASASPSKPSAGSVPSPSQSASPRAPKRKAVVIDLDLSEDGDEKLHSNGQAQSDEGSRNPSHSPGEADDSGFASGTSPSFRHDVKPKFEDSMDISDGDDETSMVKPRALLTSKEEGKPDVKVKLESAITSQSGVKADEAEPRVMTASPVRSSCPIIKKAESDSEDDLPGVSQALGPSNSSRKKARLDSTEIKPFYGEISGVPGGSRGSSTSMSNKPEIPSFSFLQPLEDSDEEKDELASSSQDAGVIIAPKSTIMGELIAREEEDERNKPTAMRAPYIQAQLEQQRRLPTLPPSTPLPGAAGIAATVLDGSVAYLPVLGPAPAPAPEVVPTLPLAALAGRVPVPVPGRVGAPVVTGVNHSMVQAGTAIPVPSNSSDDEKESGMGGLDLQNIPKSRGSVDKAVQDMLEAAAAGFAFEGEASLDKALQNLGLESMNQKIPGTNIILYPHQVLGVSFMLDRERYKKHRGGILADEMGLGKTVQTIALILLNKSDDPKEKTTLILAPMGLLEQWKDEIIAKSKAKLSVFVYHGAAKKGMSKRDSRLPPRDVELDGATDLQPPHLPSFAIPKELRKYDVVITTLGTLLTQWVPDDDTAKKQAKAKAKKEGEDWDSDASANWVEEHAQQTGDLFKMSWHRVVIDEAQNIRNKGTKSSRAVHALKSEFRWCLTGTPVTNTLGDLYPLLRFLRIKPYNNWTRWHEQIHLLEKRRPDIAGARVNAICKPILLRRNKNSTLDGKKLINLPEKHVETLMVQFSEEERDIYQHVERRSQQIFNRYLRAGTVMKNYHVVLLILLRLRQIASHFSLIAANSLDVAHTDPEAEKKEQERIYNNAVLALGKEAVNRIKQACLKRTVELIQAEKTGQEAEGEACDICFEPLDPEQTLTTPCAHIFCSPCINAYVEDRGQADADGELKKGEVPCPKCRGAVTKEKLFPIKLFEPTKAEIARATGEDEEVDGNEDEAELNRDVVSYLKKRGIGGTSQKSRQSGRKDREAELKVEKKRTIYESDAEDDREDRKHKKHSHFSKKKNDKASRGKAARKRIVVDSDDEDEEDELGTSDSEDSFIDDSGVESDDRVGGYRKKKDGKGKGKARAVDSEDDFIVDDSTENSSDSIEYVSSTDEEECFNFAKLTGKKARKANYDAVLKAVSERKGQFIASAKMKAMLKLLQEAPEDDKFLVISQRTSMLDLVASYLRQEKIKRLRFQGDMTRDQRDEAVKLFNKQPKYKCLLMSLKAGGVGLNLTGGNRVVLLDLAWSPAVEAQAFDRVHRLGQRKEVFVHRAVVEGTVEQRILDLQDRKQMLADASLGEGKRKNSTRLTIEDLKNLFGIESENKRW